MLIFEVVLGCNRFLMRNLGLIDLTGFKNLLDLIKKIVMDSGNMEAKNAKAIRSKKAYL